MQWLRNQYMGFGLMIMIMALVLVVYARPLAVVLFISLVFAALLGPIANFLGPRAGRSAAIGLALAGVLLLFSLGVATIVGSLLPSVSNLVLELPVLLQRAHSVPMMVSNYFPWLGPPEFVQGEMDDLILATSDFVSQMAKGAVKPVLEMSSQLVELISVPLLAFYWLRDGSCFKEAVSRQFPGAILGIREFLEASYEVFGAYVRGMIAVSLLSGIAVLVFGMAMGIQHIMVFAFLSLLGEWIPVVGPIIAAGFALSLIFAQAPLLAMKALVFYVILFKVNHNLVYPALVGKATRIHPVMIMLGVLFAGHLGGIFGMMVVVPLMAVLRVFYSVGREVVGDGRRK